MKKIIISIFILTLTACSENISNNNKNEINEKNGINASSYIESVLSNKLPNYKPPDGVIPDKETAITVGEAILSNIYGPDNIRGERPFNATLTEGYWLVTGSLPENWVGGVAEIVIKKDTGEVINILHGE